MNEADIADRVCGVAGIPLSILRSKRRTPAVVRARWVLLYCLNNLYPWLTLSELAAEMGKDCHGTAIWGLRKAEELYGTDTEFKRMVDSVLDEA